MWIIAILVFLTGFTLLAYELSLRDICFTRGKEGAAKMVVKGSTRDGRFDHAIMWWRGHYFNDPRHFNFDENIPEWEVLESKTPGRTPSAYDWWEIHWKWLELWGIYWYGLKPFKNIYVYTFKWTEEKADANGTAKPWHREDPTSFIYVNNFPYWVRLVGAMDKDSEPLDLDYLLTVEINNPVKALFDNDDWLARTTADANNAGKIFVGSRDFDEIKKEKLAADTATSPFALSILDINDNAVTQAPPPPGIKGGTKATYGVTIRAVSLVEVIIVGDNRAEIAKATTAKIVAERYAQAAAATAEGEANAMRIRARGRADAIDTVYGKITSHGDAGLTIRQMEALETTAQSPSNTSMVWANNPIGALASLFGGFAGKSPTHGSATPTPPAPEAPEATPTT